MRSLPAHGILEKLAAVCVLVSSANLYAADQPSFAAYAPDVAALLQEYHADSDELGSMLPSILAYQGQSNAEILVDFERGLISISAAEPRDIKRAAVEILLTQFDPTIIDGSTASDFGLINPKTQKPFFFGQIVDQDGANIASVWRAERYLEHLLQRSNGAQAERLIIPMSDQHKTIAGNKYLTLAKAASARHKIPLPLVMAIIETESSFNPLARSRSNALGLMQIKAETACRDYFSIINGRSHTPTTQFLYNPANNIEVGTGYLSILADLYLAGIYHPQKLEYAIIASYNGGTGSLFNSLAPSGGRQSAIDRINEMTVKEFYWFLTNRHIRLESQNYLKKVTARMRNYPQA